MRLRLTLTLAIALCGSWMARAQAPLPVPTSATPDQIGLWLGGQDQRMVAWGATFALQTGAPTSRAYLVARAGAWQPLQERFDTDGSARPLTPAELDQVAAMAAVLDAMIRLRVPAESAAILRLAPDFPDQAVTLFAQLPQDARHALASDLYAGRKTEEEYRQSSDYAGGMMLHFATAVLLQDRTPGVVASLIAEMHATMRLVVVDSGRGVTSGNGAAPGTCGSSIDLTQRAGWPKIMSYVVERGGAQEKDVIVLLAGDRPITSRRTGASGLCSSFGYLTDAERQSMVAEMAGAQGRLGWSLTNTDTIRYTNDVAYVQEAGRVVEDLFQKVIFTEKTLMNRQLMTLDETKHSLPSMAVTVEDRRAVKTPPLPDPGFQTPKTTVQYMTAP